MDNRRTMLAGLLGFMAVGLSPTAGRAGLFRQWRRRCKSRVVRHKVPIGARNVEPIEFISCNEGEGPYEHVLKVQAYLASAHGHLIPGDMGMADGQVMIGNDVYDAEWEEHSPILAPHDHFYELTFETDDRLSGTLTIKVGFTEWKLETQEAPIYGNASNITCDDV